MLRILVYERWAGERLTLEMAVPECRRGERPISVSAIRDGPRVDVWRHRRFLGTLLRSLQHLPGGLGRFLPCRIGAHHCRLRSTGSAHCGHGLTSRPLEASRVGFLDDLLVLFGYRAKSGERFLAGPLRMRFCSFPFSGRKPSRGLPEVGMEPNPCGSWRSREDARP